MKTTTKRQRTQLRTLAAAPRAVAARELTAVTGGDLKPEGTHDYATNTSHWDYVRPA